MLVAMYKPKSNAGYRQFSIVIAGHTLDIGCFFIPSFGIQSDAASCNAGHRPPTFQISFELCSYTQCCFIIICYLEQEFCFPEIASVEVCFLSGYLCLP